MLKKTVFPTSNRFYSNTVFCPDQDINPKYFKPFGLKTVL